MDFRNAPFGRGSNSSSPHEHTFNEIPIFPQFGSTVQPHDNYSGPSNSFRGTAGSSNETHQHQAKVQATDYEVQQMMNGGPMEQESAAAESPLLFHECRLPIVGYTGHETAHRATIEPLRAKEELPLAERIFGVLVRIAPHGRITSRKSNSSAVARSSMMTPPRDGHPHTSVVCRPKAMRMVEIPC